MVSKLKDRTRFRNRTTAQTQTLCVTLSDRQDYEHKPTLRKIKRGVARAPIRQKTPLLILPDTLRTSLTTIKVLTILTSKIIKFRNI
jgi:hypothetical protein